MLMTPRDDQFIDGSVAQARQAYRKVLSKQGLLKLTSKEVDVARSALRSRGQAHIAAEDIRFQAAITRLQSRKDMAPESQEQALREILAAEYDCDQSTWERDCHRAAMVEHLHCKLPVKAPIVIV